MTKAELLALGKTLGQRMGVRLPTFTKYMAELIAARIVEKTTRTGTSSEYRRSGKAKHIEMKARAGRSIGARWRSGSDRYDSGRGFPLDPLPSGWRHQKFSTRSPMTRAFTVTDGLPSIAL